MSRQPKQALLENMDDPVTLEQLQLLRHYVRYCSASYGKLAVGFMARSMSRMIADKEGHKFQNFVSQYTGLQETDVIHVDAKGGLHRPVHYVAVDQAMGAIVVVLRGSMSISDVLTDLNCKPDQFIFRGQHYQVHRGILRSARELDIEIRPLVLSLREDNPGFKTVVVGHSLGAGVGTLLTAIWCSEQRGEMADTTCFAFGTPCVCCHALCKELAPIVTTVVVGDDVIPRLSLASMHALRKKVVSTFDKDATTKKQDITLRDLNTTRSSSTSTRSGNSSPPAPTARPPPVPTSSSSSLVSKRPPSTDIYHGTSKNSSDPLTASKNSSDPLTASNYYPPPPTTLNDVQKHHRLSRVSSLSSCPSTSPAPPRIPIVDGQTQEEGIEGETNHLNSSRIEKKLLGSNDVVRTCSSNSSSVMPPPGDVKMSNKCRKSKDGKREERGKEIGVNDNDNNKPVVLLRSHQQQQQQQHNTPITQAASITTTTTATTTTSITTTDYSTETMATATTTTTTTTTTTSCTNQNAGGSSSSSKNVCTDVSFLPRLPPHPNATTKNKRRVLSNGYYHHLWRYAAGGSSAYHYNNSSSSSRRRQALPSTPRQCPKPSSSSPTPASSPLSPPSSFSSTPSSSFPSPHNDFHYSSSSSSTGNTPDRRTRYSEPSYTRLFPPGRILWVPEKVDSQSDSNKTNDDASSPSVKNPPSSSSDSKKNTTETTTTPSKKRRSHYLQNSRRLRSVPIEDFDEIVLSWSMFLSHLPLRYELAIAEAEYVGLIAKPPLKLSSSSHNDSFEEKGDIVVDRDVKIEYGVTMACRKDSNSSNQLHQQTILGESLEDESEILSAPSNVVEYGIAQRRKNSIPAKSLPKDGPGFGLLERKHSEDALAYEDSPVDFEIISKHVL